MTSPGSTAKRERYSHMFCYLCQCTVSMEKKKKKKTNKFHLDPLQRNYKKFSLFEYSRDKQQEAVSLFRKSDLFEASILSKIRTFSPTLDLFQDHPCCWYFLGWFWLFFGCIFVRFMPHAHICTAMIWYQPVICVCRMSQRKFFDWYRPDFP